MRTFLFLMLALLSSQSHAAPPRKKPRPAAPPPPIVAESAPEPAPSPVKWSVGAAADLRGEYFPDTLSPEVKQTFGIVNGEVTGTMKVGHSFLVKVRPTGHLDPNNPTKAEQSWADLPEGYAQLRTSLGESTAMTLQLGMNTFTWGVTDGYNPIDVVSARRYADPLNSEKLGAFSLLGRLDFGFLLVEGIYIPWQRESKLPGEKSRWLPRNLGGPISYNGTTTDLPATPVFSFAPSQSIDAALKNNIGARLSSHFLGMDAAYYIFDGSAALPAVQYFPVVDVTAVDPVSLTATRASMRPNITLRTVYNRVTVTGASVVFPVWELIVRSELAVTKAYRKGSPAITEQDTEAVAELEHTFNFEKSSFTLIGLLSYADPQDNGLQTTASPSLNRLFDRATGLGFRWQPFDELAADAYGAFDVKHGGSLWNAQLTYKVSDAWKVYGGGQVFHGTSAEPIGVYGKNSRVFAGVKLAM